MKDVTEKFANMIESFECDFSLAADAKSKYILGELQEQIISGNKKISRDIELLRELSFGIRHGKTKIMEREE